MGRSSRRSRDIRDELAAYLRGDERAFERLVEVHGGMVYRTCLRVLGLPQAAEDAAQTTFLILARKASTVRGDLAGWLHCVALNAARVALRSEKGRRAREREAARMLAHKENDQQAAETVEWDRVRPILDEAIDRLPARQRLALLNSYFEDRPRAEVAKLLKIPVGTVDSRVHNAIRRLRKELSRCGVEVRMSALAEVLAARLAEAACPEFLLAAAGRIGAAASSAAGAGALGSGVATLTKGVTKAMFWSKAKFVAAAVAAAAVLAAVVLPATGHIMGEGRAHETRAAETAARNVSLPPPSKKAPPPKPAAVAPAPAPVPVTAARSERIPVQEPAAKAAPASAPKPVPVVREHAPRPTPWPPAGGEDPEPAAADPERPKPAPPPPAPPDPKEALKKLKFKLTPLGHRNADDGWTPSCCPAPACRNKVFVRNVKGAGLLCPGCGLKTRQPGTAMCCTCAWKRRVCAACRRRYPLGNQFRYHSEPLRFEVELKNAGKDPVQIPRRSQLNLLFDAGNGKPPRSPVGFRSGRLPDSVPSGGSLKLEIEADMFKVPGGGGGYATDYLGAGRYTVVVRLLPRYGVVPKGSVPQSPPVAIRVVSMFRIAKKKAIAVALNRLAKDRPGWRKEHDWKKHPSVVHSANITSDPFQKKIHANAPWGGRAKRLGYAIELMVRKPDDAGFDTVRVLVDANSGAVAYYWRVTYLRAKKPFPNGHPGYVKAPGAKPRPKWPEAYMFR